MTTVTDAQQAKLDAAKKDSLQENDAIESSRKEAILEILALAADDSKFLAELSDNTDKVLAEYYVLSWEERAALASGDIKKIESWVGKLDKRLAKWLYCRLQQETW